VCLNEQGEDEIARPISIPHAARHAKQASNHFRDFTWDGIPARPSKST